MASSRCWHFGPSHAYAQWFLAPDQTSLQIWSKDQRRGYNWASRGCEYWYKTDSRSRASRACYHFWYDSHGCCSYKCRDWRTLRDNWDDLGYGQILSTENRAAIAKGKTPKVDDAWVKVFPEDAGLKGERIPMHHVQGTPLTVPLPDTRHLDAHMPGGFRYNPGGPGSALPAYPAKKGDE